MWGGRVSASFMATAGSVTANQSVTVTATLNAISATAAVSLQPAGAQSLGGCSMFPANNVWNTPVDHLPVDPNSAAYVSSVGTTRYLHPISLQAEEESRTSLFPGPNRRFRLFSAQVLRRATPAHIPFHPMRQSRA